jgi:DNA-binding HxlR family transcriptional regulator
VPRLPDGHRGLGRPWNALLLNVLQAGPLRYSELSAAAKGPGDKVLSARLKELESCGLLVRQVDPGPRCGSPTR